MLAKCACLAAFLSLLFSCFTSHTSKRWIRFKIQPFIHNSYWIRMGSGISTFWDESRTIDNATAFLFFRHQILKCIKIRIENILSCKHFIFHSLFMVGRFVSDTKWQFKINWWIVSCPPSLCLIFLDYFYEPESRSLKRVYWISTLKTFLMWKYQHFEQISVIHLYIIFKAITAKSPFF